MESPLVSIVCLCYNHERFVEEALLSVLNQTYSNIQIIVVDDCSTDNSVSIIKQVISGHSHKIHFLALKQNLGNCKAFNQGLALATGDFIIDFATDDVMLPDRIEKQVRFFEKQKENVGVVFTDATYINENGELIRNHYDYLFKKKLIDHVPRGNVFRDVLTTYFISSPTMMAKKQVLDTLHGYDEGLVYEDFDFWVRASRDFQFELLDEKTTKVRKSAASMSTGWYRVGDKQLHSTYLVCLKAEKFCRDEQDRDALRWRALYEFKQAVFSHNKIEAKLFAELLKRLGKVPISFFLIQTASYFPLPWPWMRDKYHQLKYS
ncbi:MAG TPA: glycosyltransferase [Cyclobacteriaceae bacterium]|jgi:glycosyltransferase involved in cell wall biosynthesis|nr:glycosyltransferase [Cyclobacteriaceae bacterium]